MNWTNQYSDLTAISMFESLGRAAIVVSATAMLTVAVVVALLYGLRRERCGRSIVMLVLLAVSLLAASWHPWWVLFGPIWRAKDDRDLLDTVRACHISAPMIFSYIFCVCGLLILIYLAVNKKFAGLPRTAKSANPQIETM